MKDMSTVFAEFNGIWPDITAKNVTAPGAGDGTEFVAALIDDGMWGWQQALLDYAGVSPNGITEAAGASQILDALKKGFALGPGYRVMYDKNGTPAANGDRVLLLQGQVIEIASYTDLGNACYVGDANNPTAPAYYKTSDAGGTTRDTAGGYFVLPDHRAVSPKGAGNHTINTRVKTGPAFTAIEEDQMQGHKHASTNQLVGPNNNNILVDSGVTGELTNAIIDNPTDDGVNGTPRTGATTRDCTIGTNFGITY